MQRTELSPAATQRPHLFPPQRKRVLRSRLSRERTRNKSLGEGSHLTKVIAKGSTQTPSEFFRTHYGFSVSYFRTYYKFSLVNSFRTHYGISSVSSFPTHQGFRVALNLSGSIAVRVKDTRRTFGEYSEQFP